MKHYPVIHEVIEYGSKPPKLGSYSPPMPYLAEIPKAKKVAGAARNSVKKKCERDTKADDAMKDCVAKAADKKLKGEAKNSYTKKCVADATK